MKDRSQKDRDIRGLRFKVWTRPGTQVYLSKAKLGIYSEYLGPYIYVSEIGVAMSQSGVIMRGSTRS